jgi:hypothetical protein
VGSAHGEGIPDKPFDPWRAINSEFRIRGEKRAAAQQAWEAKDVVAVEVRDENLGNFLQCEGRRQQLMLSPFPAVKQPYIALWSRELQSDACYVAQKGGPARASAEKVEQQVQFLLEIVGFHIA